VVVKLLLKKGADSESKDTDGRTPLSWASEEGHEVVVKLLPKKGASSDSKDIIGHTSLLRARRHQGLHILRKKRGGMRQ